MNDDKKNVYLDADVINHFIAGLRFEHLPRILSPHNTIILEDVYNEVLHRIYRNYPFVCSDFEKKIRNYNFSIIPISNDKETTKEYFKIQSEHSELKEKGECACMAMAKINNGIVASSNLKDIFRYCKENKIVFIGTLDILLISALNNIFTEYDCDCVITNAIQINDGKFPPGVTAIKYYKTPDYYDNYIGYFYKNTTL